MIEKIVAETMFYSQRSEFKKKMMAFQMRRTVSDHCKTNKSTESIEIYFILVCNVQFGDFGRK